MKNTERQPSSDTSGPPTTGPPPPAMPATPPHRPSALRRAARSLKVAWISDSDAGTDRAAPTPCAARAAIRKLTSGANAHASEQVQKIAMPLKNARLAPRLSLIIPPLSSRAANVRL